MSTCEHGRPVDADGTVTCQDCDWCDRCEAVRRYTGETCATCGRVWGED